MARESDPILSDQIITEEDLKKALEIITLGAKSATTSDSKEHRIAIDENPIHIAQTLLEHLEKLGYSITKTNEQPDITDHQAMKETISRLAHDINNMLASVLGNIALCTEDPKTPPQTRHKLSATESAAITAYSKIQQWQRVAGDEKEEIRKESVDIGTIVENSVEQARGLLRNNPKTQHLEIKLEANCETDLTVLGDAHALNSALVNLIKNSIEAMHNPEGTITIDAKKEYDTVVVIITDTGIGMDNLTRQKTSELHFSTKKSFGRGIGMTAVNKTLENHNGQMTIVTTSPGKGTSIRIELPYVEKTVKTEEVKEKRNVEKIQSAKVLIVDDEKAIRNVVGSILDREGHKTDFACNAEEALDLLQESDYDIVITDISMPIKDGKDAVTLNGWDLSALIKAHHPGIKIIVMTGGGSNTEDEKLKVLGIDHVIQKPFNIYDLLEIVTTSLKKEPQVFKLPA